MQIAAVEPTSVVILRLIRSTQRVSTACAITTSLSRISESAKGAQGRSATAKLVICSSG